MAVVLPGVLNHRVHQEEPPKSPLLAEVKKAKPKVRVDYLSEPSRIDGGLDASGSSRSAGCLEKNHAKHRNRFLSEPARVSQAFLQPLLAAEASLPSLRPRPPVSAWRDEVPTSKSASPRKDSSRLLARVEIPTGRKLSNSSSLSEVTRRSSKLARLGASVTRSSSKRSDREVSRSKFNHRHSLDTSIMPPSLPSASDAKLSKFRAASTCDSFFSEPSDQSEDAWPSLDDTDCTPTTAHSRPFDLESFCSFELEDDCAPVTSVSHWSSEGNPSVATPIGSLHKAPALLPDVKPAPKGVTSKFRWSTSRTTSTYYSAKGVVEAQAQIDPEEEAKARKAKVQHVFYCFCAPGRKDLDSGRFKRLCLVSNLGSGASPSSDARRWWSTIVGDKEIMAYEQFKSVINLMAFELNVPVDEVESKFVGATKPLMGFNERNRNE